MYNHGSDARNPMYWQYGPSISCPLCGNFAGRQDEVNIYGDSSPIVANVVLSNTEFNVVGTRPLRPDGVDKVTGRARYSADLALPGLLHGKILRSPHAHARIKSIDASRALALPGVRAVISSTTSPIRVRIRC